MTHKNPQPTMPARMKLVSATSGFVITVGRVGPCFEWFKLVDGEWRSHHILQNDNWLLQSAEEELPCEMTEKERISFRDRKERIEERRVAFLTQD